MYESFVDEEVIFLINKRVSDPLKKALDKGKKFFFLYGDGIKDCFLEDIYDGILSLRDILKTYFLSREDCEIFALISTDGVQVLRKQQSTLIDISSNYLTLASKSDNEMPDDEEEGEGETDPRLQKSSENGEAGRLKQSLESNHVNLLNQIGIIKMHAQDKNISTKKTVVFFEDFEWMGKLYSSNNNDSLAYIKALKDFYKIEECYTLVSLEDTELVRKYNFETKGSNVIFLGNPSADEIKYAYLLRFLGVTNFENNGIQLDLFAQLNDVSQAVSASKKSLREALQVLDAIVIDTSKKRINSIDFEIAIERITAEKVQLDDVIINEEEKENVINAIDAFLNSKESKDYRKGFILTGPPGTGKTQLVKALANEKNCYFMAPKLSDLKGEYVGQTSGKVKRIFDEARANAPTIMFIDEADTVFPSRDIGGGVSDSYNLDMVNQFLQEIEGMTSGEQKIFVIAATNRPNIIDAAIQSRLTERIPIGLPNAENRIKIFNKKFERYNFSLNGKKYLNDIQSKTVNMSGRDIENFVKKLNEYIKETPFSKIENLKNDDESHKILLKVLESNERTLIEDLQKSVPVEVKEPSGILVGIKDIIGYEHIKNRIARQTNYIKCTESEKTRAWKFGIKVSKGVLLYGPPGNAKTMLAQAIAKDNNFYFVKVLSKDFASDSISKQLDNIQIIFDQVIRLSKMCSKYEGVVLFFDEFDALASCSYLNQVVRGTLLDYLASGDNQTNTGIRSAQSRILLIAATNFIELLDDAVIRKGRIDEHLFMDNPSKEEGIQMLKEKFESDTKIVVEKVDVCDIYEKLSEYIYTHNPSIKGNNEKEEIRPSGSTIINLYDELKAEAYFSQVKEQTIKDKLILTPEIVDGYFCNLNKK